MERTQTTSTSIKRPWGGQLDTGHGAPLKPQKDALETLGFFLRKWTELCLLAALVAVPMMYHFNFPAHVLDGMHGWFLELQKAYLSGFITFYDDQVDPYIRSSWPVLESKFSAWFVLGMAMILGYAATRLLEGVTGREFIVAPQHVPHPTKARVHRWVPMVAIAVFLLYSLASLLFWPPTAPLEAQILTGKGLQANTAAGIIGKISTLGGAGFFHSIVAWSQVAFALFFFLIAEDIIRERPFVNKIMAIMVIIGLLNALTVLLQKIEFEPLMAIWPRWSDSDTRNNLGAFIGHNTGVSSFLMAPLMISLMWMVSVQPRRRQLFRGVLLLVVLVMVLAMILTQSRAVLPITAFCCAIMIFMMYRRSVLLRKSRLFVWLPVAIAFVILTQLIPTTYNPLYRRDVTLATRLGEFRTTRLQTETRLRILVVSFAELIPRSPLVGTGWGTFQYVYPPAQGQYFQHNPRSVLAPTDRRSFHAHNEYLQTLIETGILGVAIAITGLVVLIVGGWRSYQRTLMPHHIAMQAAIFAAMLAYLLHAFVDFPLRIPPLTLTLVVLMAIWSAGDRLWNFPVKPLVDEDFSAKPPVTSPSPRLYRFSTTGHGRALFLIVGAVIVIAMGAAFVALQASGMNRLQTAEVLLMRATNELSYYQSDPERNHVALVGGFNDAFMARRDLWISGPANRMNGTVSYLRAASAYEVADEQAKAGAFELAAKTRAQANVIARGGINDLNMALSEEYFNGLYLRRSELYRILAQNADDDKRREYQNRWLEDLVRAVNMNPGDALSMFNLIQLREQNPRANNAEIVRYLGTLHHFHKPFFDSTVVSRVMDALSLDENQDALTKMQQITEAVPDDPDYQATYAYVLVRNGNIDAARLVTQQQAGTSDSNKSRRDLLQMVRVNVAMAQNDFGEARKLLQAVSSGVPSAAVKAYLLFLPAETDEQNRDKVRLREELIALGKQDPINYQIVGATAYSNFRNMEEAADWLERRRNAPAPAPPMDLQGRCLLAKTYARLQRWDDLRKMLSQNDCESPSVYASHLCRAITAFLQSQLDAASSKDRQ
ncbi:O-antigen ligase family protein [Candidatus Sumerlaeota bacterium]|nr:O-antigen ligase family protein [Candidatus Sumerlaeota bacterium]